MIDKLAKIRRFFVSESGPTAVEYGVMLALIVSVCALGVSLLGTKVSGTFSSVHSSIS